MTPWTLARQAPLSTEFSRQEYWSGLPFPSPGDLPDPGIKPASPAFQADSSLSEPPGKAMSPAKPGRVIKATRFYFTKTLVPRFNSVSAYRGQTQLHFFGFCQYLHLTPPLAPLHPPWIVILYQSPAHLFALSCCFTTEISL